ncbi:phosphatase PAP2 family protein [Flagellimonas aequoris]|uniref:Phosphatase PAP2 family protein n=1 Tax=Flagellimonas aequoris TaxID=2306997 RepID=A0A418N2B7_9FLAO|nr:phosphatase PAP2 family protein [Allomuricauda aequoris]RIV67465.1 phosphatase PAP2 family protein [Allomuricauda aequoris]TXJ99288.1 phosphatase PAP2 family protein [Allomuricauda aequoris]
MWENLLQWDRDTFVYLNSLGIERYDGFWSTVTDITTWIPLFLLFLFLLFQKFDRKEALYKFFTIMGLVIFITAITHWTKISVARLRPNNTEEINTIIRILKSPTDYSFFSGHASSSFSITTLVFLFLRKKVKWAFLFFLWPILFCMSRIYVGVHFPIDIIVGAIVGILSGMLFYWLYNRFITPGLKSVRP